MSKPCVHCRKPAPATFDHESVFEEWADRNEIIGPWRSRFDGVRERLKHMSLDETDDGCHPECGLEWAVRLEGFAKRYPA